MIEIVPNNLPSIVNLFTVYIIAMVAGYSMGNMNYSSRSPNPSNTNANKQQTRLTGITLVLILILLATTIYAKTKKIDIAPVSPLAFVSSLSIASFAFVVGYQIYVNKNVDKNSAAYKKLNNNLTIALVVLMVVGVGSALAPLLKL